MKKIKKKQKKSIKKNTKIFFFESPSNPCLEIIDIKQVCLIAKKNKISFLATLIV